jgi:hypothetical protein
VKTQIFMPVSRPDYLDRVFADIEFLDCDRSNTGLVVLVDGDNKLYDQTKTLVEHSKFDSKLCFWRGDRTPVKKYALAQRRARISAIHNEARLLIPQSDFVFLVEDDGLIPPQSLKQLSEDYLRYPFAGFVSGVCIGRHGIQHIGAWEVDDPYETTEISSVRPADGLEKVDAAGFFAMLTRWENYTAHEFAPFHDVLGPDVEYGLALRRTGFTNYVDHMVAIEHLTSQGSLSYARADIVKATLTKFGDAWKQAISKLER